jgi:hypothetical protein
MSEASETVANETERTARSKQVDLEPVRQAAEDVLTAGYGLTLLALDGLETFVQRAYERGKESRSTAGPVAGMLFDLLRQPATPLTRKPKPVRVPVLPIADYDTCNVDEVVQALAGLSPEDLKLVRSYEREHKNRKTVLNAIEQKLAAAGRL